MPHCVLIRLTYTSIVIMCIWLAIVKGRYYFKFPWQWHGPTSRHIESMHRHGGQEIPLILEVEVDQGSSYELRDNLGVGFLLLE